MDKFHIEYYFLIKINEKCKTLHRFKLFYKEGKKEDYLKYLESKYSFNGEDLLNKMSKEEFYDFESNIFDENYIKKVIGRWLNDLN